MDKYQKTVHFVKAQAQASLTLLKEGNFRHNRGDSKTKPLDLQRRAVLAKGQNPYAVVLGCADSRVPPELVFDVGLGELFVVRNMGNLASESAIGSIEYAVKYLHCPLVVVLAHSNCGAIKAAVSGGKYTETIDRLLATITPSVQKEVDVDEVAKAHALQMVDILNQNKTIVEHGAVVVPAFYEIATGEVLWLQTEG